MRLIRCATFGIAMLAGASSVVAQDVPGIEICTVDKTMERRTSCLQSNVDFLVKTINRLRSENDQKLDSANRQIAALQAAVTTLQKSMAEFQAVKSTVRSTDAPAPSSEKALPPPK